jgi:hypothetical protein
MYSESIKLNRTRTTDLYQDYPVREITFWALAGILLVLILGYIYLINNTIYMSVDWKNKLADIEKLGHNISADESEYMALVNSIDLTRAESLGLLQTTKISYIPKTSYSSGLSLNTGE